jgi:hypothetical protein
MNQLNAHVDSRPLTVSHHTSARQHCSIAEAGKEIQWGREEIDEKGKTAGPKTLQIRYKCKCLREIDTKKILRHWFEKVAKIDFFQSRGV